MTEKKKRPLNRTRSSWSNMLKRVKQKTSVGRYKDVTIDSRWLIYEEFLADMGERPSGKTLDRINPDLGYCKDNCRWATPTEQAANRRYCIYVEHNGERLVLKHLCQRLGVAYKRVHYRVRYLKETPMQAIEYVQNVSTKRNGHRL